MKTIKEKIRTINEISHIQDVIRINKINTDKNKIEKWTPTKSLRITFKGPLPERVIIGHTSYKTQQYTFPIPKCYNCLRYGHGILNCKNKKRCSRCSSINHEFKNCMNDQYCFFCDEKHIPNSNECDIHKKHKKSTNKILHQITQI